MNWAVGIIFFSDKLGLERTLNSIPRDFMAFCIDGGIPSRGHNGISTDGSRDVVKSFNNALLIDCPDCSEVDKRNKYLQLCEEYNIDFLIVIDSDEYITGDIDRFKTNASGFAIDGYNIYGILSKNLYNSEYSYRPRLWYKPYEMTYTTAHYIFKRKDAPPNQHYSVTSNIYRNIDGIRIEHDKSLRSSL